MTTRAVASGMGTTLVAAVWHPEGVTCGHVGDSRLYVMRGRELRQLTRDHSMVQEQLALAIYRACFSIGSLYLRTCQIYTHLPKGLWFQLHQLLQLAEHLNLARTPVPDPLLQQRKVATVKESYLRTLMLACSRANQLSQQDLQFAYEAYETWAGYVNLRGDVAAREGNPFVVHLPGDEPPAYRARFNQVDPDELLELDFSGLVSALNPQKARSDVTTPKGMPAELIRHLLNTWQATPDRQQHRHQVKTVVDVCIGITECHYHFADEKTFAAFMGRSGRPNPSDWHDLPDYSARGVTPGDRKNVDSDMPAYVPARVHVQNISAGGYCLYWQNDMPSHASAGQLLGIREAGQKDWHLGVVRWVRQLRGASQMGVQVLAMHAEPAAASLIYDMGGYSDAMRVLQIPPNTAKDAPATIVTAAAPFQEHSRVRLVNGKSVITLKLDQIIFATNKLRQFTYQVIGAEEEPAAKAIVRTESSFDSEWD